MKNRYSALFHFMLLVYGLTSLELYAALAKGSRGSKKLASKGQLASSTQDSKTVLEQEVIVDPVGEIEQYDPRKDEFSTVPVTPQERNAKEEPILDVSSETKKELTPIKEIDEPEIIFNFENADLQNVITYIESIFDVTFIPDDAINPMLQTGKAVSGNKITFKTHKPLTKNEAWGLFTTFLDMAGLSLYKDGSAPNVYRISSINNVKKAPIPAFIGVDSELLPDSDIKIRYVYFIENTTLDTIRGIVDSLRSSTSSITFLQELKAFMLTDSAYNIKVLMRIVKELDKVTMPQAMSVLKLKRVDAARVKALYDSLVQQTEQAGPAGRIIGARKPSTAQYFPEDARIIAEPRTNSLIILGSHDAITKIEDFIIKHIDVEITAPYSPLHIHPLRYADAETVAAIMNNVAKFGQNTPAAQAGGVRGQDKYLKPMSFTAEPTSNRIIVRGDYEDFLKAKEIMEQLDEPQPQVAIEVLILSLTNNDAKELGAQIRSKSPGGPNGLLGNNVKFQTSGLRAGGTPQGIVTNNNATTGSQRILGDLINLVIGKGVGNTIVSLGTDQFGVWGIFQALESVTNVQVISNPFLIATNKTPALISLGETRRVVTANVISGTTTTPTFSNSDANLEVKITPQINSDGMIILTLTVTIDTFTIVDPTSTNGAKTTKKVETATIVANKEILALGGLVKNRISDNVTKTPILGDIPILGWLFKNKRKEEVKENLLILISTRIIEPFAKQDVAVFTKEHIKDYRADIQEMRSVINERDPVDRSFFKDKPSSTSERMDRHIFKRTEFEQNFEHEEESPKKTIVKKRRKKIKKTDASKDLVPPIEENPKPIVPPQPITECESSPLNTTQRRVSLLELAECNNTSEKES
jgi:general secretion pathway protein D